MLPGTKVFVGNLALNSRPEQLREMFEGFGVVTECEVRNRCGFVHMQTPEMAKNAIDALNNISYNGTRIKVEPGRMRKPDPNAGTTTRNNNANIKSNTSNGNSGAGDGFQSRNNVMRGGGAPGPMRHNPMPGMRQMPYQRDNRSNYNRGYGMQSAGDIPFNNMGYENGGYGFGNEDRRGGYAFPERNAFDGGSSGGMYFEQRNNSGLERDRVGGWYSQQSEGYGGVSSTGYERRPYRGEGGGNRQQNNSGADSGELFSRRPMRGDGGMRGAQRGEEGGNFISRNSYSNFNQSFSTMGRGEGR